MANKKIKGLTVLFEGDITGVKKAVKDASSEMQGMQKALSDVNKALKLDPTNVDLLNNKQELLKKSIEETKKTLIELYKIRDQLDTNPENRLTQEYANLQLQITKAETSFKEMVNQLNQMPAHVRDVGKELQDLGSKLDNISNKTKRLSQVSVGLIGASITSAMSYESSIADIEKVTGSLAESTVENLKEVAVATGSAFSEISEYAAIAATLGIAEENLASFAKTMKDLETATSGAISGEEGAKEVARFLNVMGIGAEYASNFGSSITYVGDQFAATGDEILEVASRMGGLSVIGNITQHDLIGLAAEMKNLGLKSESSASAITRTFLAIEQNVASSGDELAIFAKTAGMSAEEFTAAWEKEPVDAFLKFADGLKSEIFLEISEAVSQSSDSVQEFAEVLNMSAEDFIKAWGEDASQVFDDYINSMSDLSDESESASVTLKGVKLNGVRTAEALLKLAGNGDVVRKAIQDSNTAWEKNTTLTEKASTVYNTAAKRVESMWEQLKQAGEALGKEFLPFAESAVDKISDLAKWFTNSSPAVKKFTAATVGVGAAVSPVTKILGKAFTMLADGAKSSGERLTSFQDVIKILPNLLGNFGVAGALTVAVGGLAAFAIASQYTQSETAKLNKTLNEEIEALNNQSLAAHSSYEQTAISLEAGQQRIEKIQELIAMLNDEQITEAESAQIKADLRGQIDLLNTSLGDTLFSYDEESGAIEYLGEKVDDLTSKYENLATEKRKQAWISANEEIYQNALQTVSGIDETYAAIVQGFQTDTEGISEYIKNLFKETREMSAEEKGKAFNNLTESELAQYMRLQTAYTNAQKASEAAQEQMKQSQAIIETYEGVVTGTVEDSTKLIELWEKGLPMEVTMENFQNVQEQLDDLIEKRDLMEEFDLFDEEDRAKIDSDIEYLEGVLAAFDAKMGTTLEESGGEAAQGIVDMAADAMKTADETMITDIQETGTKMKGIFSEDVGPSLQKSLSQSGKSAAEEITDIFSRLRLPNLRVGVEYYELNKPTGLTSSISSYWDDAGFEIDPEVLGLFNLNSAILKAQPQTSLLSEEDDLAQAANESIVMMRNSLLSSERNTAKRERAVGNNQVKIEFVVNNAGKDLTESDIDRFSKKIVKIVNDGIGRKI